MIAFYRRAILLVISAALLHARVSQACGSDTGGNTYNVGPNQPYAKIAEVNLTSLLPGDWICIYPGTYYEKFMINRPGTVGKPIVISGVPDANGALPIIDGKNAITPLYLNFWNDQRSLIKIGGGSTPNGPAEHIRVQFLKVQNANQDNSFTDDGGNSGTYYAKNAACILTEAASHISIVGNEITGCGNGIFSSPNTQDLIIAQNYIHSNGVPNSFYEHNTYTEATRITYRANRFGPLCTDCLGNNLKDRSAGATIAYNFILGGNRQLDLVDSGNLNSLTEYGEDFVFGNILVENGDGNRQVIHFGGDSGNINQYRTKLYLFHNTILSQRSGKSTLVRLGSDASTVYASNNIIYATESGGTNFELLAEKRGTLYFTNNWITDGYINWVVGTYGGSIIDSGTIGPSDTGPIFQDPNFATSLDFHLQAPLLLGSTLSGMPELDEEYVMHTSLRPQSEVDLGAFGFATTLSSPSPTNSPTPFPTPNPTEETTPSPTKSPTPRPTPNPTEQTTEPPTSPPMNCENDMEWGFKDCSWVAKKPTKRCNKRGIDGRRANQACLEACSDGVDDPSWSVLDCNWVSKRSNNRCGKVGVDGRSALDACPAICDPNCVA